MDFLFPLFKSVLKVDRCPAEGLLHDQQPAVGFQTRGLSGHARGQESLCSCLVASVCRFLAPLLPLPNLNTRLQGSLAPFPLGPDVLLTHQPYGLEPSPSKPCKKGVVSHVGLKPTQRPHLPVLGETLEDSPPWIGLVDMPRLIWTCYVQSIRSVWCLTPTFSFGISFYFLELQIFKVYFIFNSVCVPVWVYVLLAPFLWRAEEGTGSFGAGITGSCQLSSMNPRNQPQSFSRRVVCTTIKIL